MGPISVATSRAFDLDGTLIDARTRQVAVAASALAETTGQRLDASGFWRRKRAGGSTVDALAGLGYPSAVAAAVGHRWSEQIEADEWLELDRALSGVRRVLELVHGDGARVVVITARRRESGARLSVDSAQLGDLVDELVVVSPSRAVAEKAAALRSFRAGWFIGDTASDGEAGRAAGVPFCAVTTGQRSRGHLIAAGFKPERSLGAAVRALSASAPPERR